MSVDQNLKSYWSIAKRTKRKYIKWDRFSRNTAESYQMISVFNQLSIQVNPIEQPLDLTVPEQGLMLAVYHSIPEVENQRQEQLQHIDLL